VATRLVRGRGGVFEVTCGNDLLFSKKKQGRFPRSGEVEDLVARRLERELG
jgi:selT/selW/selH-like putative selenoprotein